MHGDSEIGVENLEGVLKDGEEGEMIEVKAVATRIGQV